jgi:hypothetical protein
MMPTSTIRPPLERRQFSLHVTIIPLPVMTGVGWLQWRLSLLVDRLAIVLVVVRRFLSLDAMDSRSL